MQPGNVHLKGPLSSLALAAARCFFEMWPVSAASEPKLAVQSPHAHDLIPLTQWADFKCFFRSATEAKDAEQVVPHGINHWHIRELVGNCGLCDCIIGLANGGCGMKLEEDCGGV